MRSRKSKSSNTFSETILCECCRTMIALRRRPRFNAKGLRVAKIQGMERGREIVPVLRLTGKWLDKAGFGVGALIEIECKRGKLIIGIDEQAMAEFAPT